MHDYDGEIEVPAEIIPQYDAPGNCFLSVARLVRDRGGSAVTGWLVRPKLDGLFDLWTHHCIWRTPDGRLVDVTPQRSHFSDYQLPPCNRFVPDPSATLIAKPDGLYVRPSRAIPLVPAAARLTDAINRAEDAWARGDEPATRYWRKKVDRLLSKRGLYSPGGFGRLAFPAEIGGFLAAGRAA